MKESKKSRTSTSIRVDSHSTESDRKSNQYSILIHKHNMKKSVSTVSCCVFGFSSNVYAISTFAVTACAARSFAAAASSMTFLRAAASKSR